MPIYYGSQKVKPNGIKEAYYGSQKVYSASRLPAGYQKVEYIESSGTQYIRTGATQAQYLKCEIDFQATYYSNSDEYSMGIINAASPTCRNFPVYLYNGNGTFGLGGGTQYIDTGIALDYNRHIGIVDNVNRIASLDSTSLTINSFTSTTENSVDYDFVLFARRAYSSYLGNQIQAHFYGRIYSAKLWKSGTLVRDFVPCYRTADSVIGLYDLVNNQFYTNSGTGTFTKGSDV